MTWGVWVEPTVGIEPTTFSLRGGTTPSHPLSTTGFGNTAAGTVREIPHKYPSFRATGYATADGVSKRITAVGAAAMEQIVPRISDADVGMGFSKHCSGRRNLIESPGGTVRITDGR